jgi:hypothetical protein
MTFIEEIHICRILTWVQNGWGKCEDGGLEEVIIIRMEEDEDEEEEGRKEPLAKCESSTGTPEIFLLLFRGRITCKTFVF